MDKHLLTELEVKKDIGLIDGNASGNRLQAKLEAGKDIGLIHQKMLIHEMHQDKPKADLEASINKIFSRTNDLHREHHDLDSSHVIEENVYHINTKIPNLNITHTYLSIDPSHESETDKPNFVRDMLYEHGLSTEISTNLFKYLDYLINQNETNNVTVKYIAPDKAAEEARLTALVNSGACGFGTNKDQGAFIIELGAGEVKAILGFNHPFYFHGGTPPNIMFPDEIPYHNVKSSLVLYDSGEYESFSSAELI